MVSVIALRNYKRRFLSRCLMVRNSRRLMGSSSDRESHTTTLLIGRVVHHSKLRQRMSALPPCGHRDSFDKCPLCADSGHCGVPSSPENRPLTSCSVYAKHLSRNRNWVVTESLQLNGSLIECRVSHEFEMANAAKFFGLFKSPSMVVVSVTARERSEHRSLVFAVSLSSRTAD